MRFSGKNPYERHDYGINIGLSSLLLIFTVLCLVSFATLSIASAYADKRLNDKVCSRTSAYYKACDSAEEEIAACDNKLCESYMTGISEDDYYAKWGKNISFSVPVSDTQSLDIKLKVIYPAGQSGPFYSISSWKTLNTSDSTELDTHLPVIK